MRARSLRALAITTLITLTIIMIFSANQMTIRAHSTNRNSAEASVPHSSVSISSDQQSDRAGKTKANELFGGRVFIQLKDGGSAIGVIYDLTGTDPMLVLLDGRRFPLSRITMINYQSTEQTYPGDRDRIQENLYTFIMQDGEVIAGRLTDYIVTEEHFWELNDGRRISTNQIARIYFP